MLHNKTYLGGGIYAVYEGLDIVLTTERGGLVMHRIVLTREAYNQLVNLVQQIGGDPASSDSER